MTNEERRTKHDEGRQPIAIGHLSDSGDLKRIIIEPPNLSLLTKLFKGKGIFSIVYVYAKVSCSSMKLHLHILIKQQLQSTVTRGPWAKSLT